MVHWFCQQSCGHYVRSDGARYLECKRIKKSDLAVFAVILMENCPFFF
jgi:hypothetical protein